MDIHREPWSAEKRSFGSFFCFWSVHGEPRDDIYSQRF